MTNWPVVPSGFRLHSLQDLRLSHRDFFFDPSGQIVNKDNKCIARWWVYSNNDDDRYFANDSDEIQNPTLKIRPDKVGDIEHWLMILKNIEKKKRVLWKNCENLAVKIMNLPFDKAIEKIQNTDIFYRDSHGDCWKQRIFWSHTAPQKLTLEDLDSTIPKTLSKENQKEFVWINDNADYLEFCKNWCSYFRLQRVGHCVIEVLNYSIYEKLGLSNRNPDCVSGQVVRFEKEGMIWIWVCDKRSHNFVTWKPLISAEHISNVSIENPVASIENINKTKFDASV